MHLVQLLLPLYDNEGKPFPRAVIEQVARELTDAFGGLTAYTRSRAQGRWREADENAVAHDDIIIHEVMSDKLDREWWTRYRQALEKRFDQDQLVIRVHEIVRL